MKDLIEKLAAEIAARANTCCYRSDGFEEDIATMAREKIAAAIEAEREECAKECEKYFKPDEYPPGHYAKMIRARKS